MKFTTKTNYGLRALVKIAQAYKQNQFISANEISKQEKIPYRYLELILSILRNSGFIRSRQGINGGYTLARPPDKITFGAVIIAFEGSYTPIDWFDSPEFEDCSLQTKNRFLNLADRLHEAISEVVENTTLDELSCPI